MNEASIRKPKSPSRPHREASQQALEYAKLKLHELHDDEVWILAQRLHAVMTGEVRKFLEEIARRDEP